MKSNNKNRNVINPDVISQENHDKSADIIQDLSVKGLSVIEFEPPRILIFKPVYLTSGDDGRSEFHHHVDIKGN